MIELAMEVRVNLADLFYIVCKTNPLGCSFRTPYLVCPDTFGETIPHKTCTLHNDYQGLRSQAIGKCNIEGYQWWILPLQIVWSVRLGSEMQSDSSQGWFPGASSIWSHHRPLPMDCYRNKGRKQQQCTAGHSHSYWSEDSHPSFEYEEMPSQSKEDSQ